MENEMKTRRQIEDMVKVFNYVLDEKYPSEMGYEPSEEEKKAVKAAVKALTWVLGEW